MGWLRWIFLENLIAFAVVVGVANFFLLVAWRRGRSVRPLLAGLVLTVVLFGVHLGVTTRREHAGAALKAIERDLVNDRADAVQALLAPSFSAYGMDKAAFVDLVEDRLDALDLTYIGRTRLRVVQEAETRFAVEADYYADVRGLMYSGPFRSRWFVEFVRTPDGWRIGTTRALQPSWMAIRDAR
jgi:hypothetical protein